MKAILLRLKEPSTYAGMAALMVSLNFLPWDMGMWGTVFTWVAATAGLVAMFLPDEPTAPPAA